MDKVYGNQKKHNNRNNRGENTQRQRQTETNNLTETEIDRESGTDRQTGRQKDRCAKRQAEEWKVGHSNCNRQKINQRPVVFALIKWNLSNMPL